MTRRSHQTQTKPNARYYLNRSTAMPNHEQNLELFQLLETAQCRISEIKANPDAHPAELKKWERTAERLLEQLISANEGLVASIARKYENFGMDTDDLISVGRIGLAKAITKFDYRLGKQFATFSYHLIRGGITRSLSAQARTIRIPEGRLAEIRKVKSARGRLRQASGVEPTAEEIAWEMGLSEEKVRALLASDLQIVSMASPVGDNGDLTYGELIRDQFASDPHRAAERADMLELVEEAAKTLGGLEREVFLMFMDDPRRSLEETGKSFGLSGERIRQIRSAAFEKVRAYLEGKDRKAPEKPIRTVAAGTVKQIPAPVAKSRGFYLKMRAVEKNPNHHIWNNNGTWYCNFTLVSESGKENRVRNPLYTDNVEDARRRRDKMILLYNGLSDTAA